MSDTADPKPQAQAQTRATRDLNDAIEGVFAAEVGGASFAVRLCELVLALTNAPSVSLWAVSRDEAEEASFEMIGSQGKAQDPQAVQDILAVPQEKLDGNRAAAVMEAGHLIATIAQPDGSIARLVLAPLGGGGAALGLAYERLSLVSQLSFSHFRNGEVMAQATIRNAIDQIAGGQPEATQALADALAGSANADYAAVAEWQAGQLSNVAISGQAGGAKRAQLPAQVRNHLTRTAREATTLPTRLFAAAPRSDNGLVMLLERPRRATDLLKLAGAFYGQAAHGSQRRRWNWKRISKWAAAAVIVICIGLVPIPDGAQVSATVEPLERRIITAPLNTTLKKLEVEDGDVVAQGDPLVQLDVQDIELELIGLKAERTTAVLEQETARASNSAATLRNAELEVERLSSRIALSEYKLGFATLRAPISGVVVLGDLDGRSGATVRSGQDLLEISNPDALYLELLVREAEIGKFSPNERGFFRPDFDPSLRIPVEVGTLSPALDLTGVVPVARAKATLAETSRDLRPGVRGIVLVGEQDRAIWNVLYTALRDWVLLRFWL